MRTIFFILILLGPAVSFASSVNKPIVCVRFEVKEQQYRDHFARAIQDLEPQLTALLVRALTNHIGFLEFRADCSPVVLRFILDDKSPSDKGTIREVGLRIRLSGGDFEPAETYWTYRRAEAYLNRFGTAQSFVEDVTIALMRADYGRLVRDVLSNVPIARSAMVMHDTSDIAWIIPFRARDLHLRFDGTQFEIENMVKGDYGVEIPTLHAEPTGVFRPPHPDKLASFEEDIMARPCIEKHPEDQTKLEKLRHAPIEAITVERVYIKQYQYGDTEIGEPIPPEEAFRQAIAESK